MVTMAGLFRVEFWNSVARSSGLAMADFERMPRSSSELMLQQQPKPSVCYDSSPKTNNCEFVRFLSGRTLGIRKFTS